MINLHSACHAWKTLIAQREVDRRFNLEREGEAAQAEGSSGPALSMWVD